MKTKAFTLIELLVVVAIIGILAAVGVVAYNGYTKSAKASTHKSNHTLVVKYISAEIKDLASFKLFSKFGNYNSFKIVNGHNVEFVYKNFSPNSAGPFGNDIKGNWISYENFLEFLKFRINNDGWFDVHC